MQALDLLAASPVAAALRRSEVLYPLVNAGHILGLALLVGAIATLDLRLLGLFGRHPLAHLGPPLRRVAAAGLVLAVATGVPLFSVRPVAYAANPAFLLKLGLVGLGIANAAVLHRSPRWRAAIAGAPVSAGLRAAALLSLLVWVAAIGAGRWIGFLE
ncbi:DUF2214 domain-containing protein [Falsiroseomonas oryzae]|uniref:DUF2214 domain-containing protein n=1 Tax=Falsiroseomonas oryzae TaxID=2766473 RepID=UPI0022EB0E24|nr:DUF2214 domain-containing protein [Roseomonas sp. MO-31]